MFAFLQTILGQRASYDFATLSNGKLQMNLRDLKADLNLMRARKQSIQAFYLKSAADVKIACVYLQISTAPVQSRYTLLCNHGGTTDLGDMINYYFTLGRILNCNIIGYDYAGFGISTGKLSEKQLQADCETVMKYAMENLKISKSKIILQGQSLGTIAAIHLASKHRVAGVILISPFLQIPSLQLKDHSIDKVEEIQSPLLIIHGKEDDLTPINQAKEIYECCSNPVKPLYLDDIGHWGIELHEQLLDRLRLFVKCELN